MSYTNTTLAKYEDILINSLGISEDVVNFATSTYGYNVETLENILYYFTGYRTFDQLENE